MIATAEPFDPAKVEPPVHAERAGWRFRGLPVPLLAGLERSAPQIDISIRQLLPEQGERRLRGLAQCVWRC